MLRPLRSMSHGKTPDTMQPCRCRWLQGLHRRTIAKLMQSYEEFEREIYEEIRQENLFSDPVLSEYSIAQFMSHSAGKGRKRKTPKTITLIVSRFGKATTWNKFPFDEIPGELDMRNNLTEQQFIDRLLDGRNIPE